MKTYSFLCLRLQTEDLPELLCRANLMGAFQNVYSKGFGGDEITTQLLITNFQVFLDNVSFSSSTLKKYDTPHI